MTKAIVRIVLFVLAVGIAGIRVGKAQDDRKPDEQPRDGAPRRRDDESPPPPAKQKGKELFERDFPGPRDGRPGGDKVGSPKGKAGPGDRRPGEESPHEEQVRQQSETSLYMHDRNRDRKLDRSEWAYPNDFENVDRDNDGFITLDELIKAPRTMVGGQAFPAFGGRGAGGIPVGPNGEMSGQPTIGVGPRFGRGPMMPGMPGMPGTPVPFGEPPGDDPEMRELLGQDHALNEQALALAQHVKRASGEERTKLKADLVEVVNKHFDVRQKRRELQLKRMEDELQRLREAISTRNKSRESIVTNHMKELVGEERDLEF